MPTKNKKGQKRSARPTVAQKRPRACFMQVQDGGSAASNNNTWNNRREASRLIGRGNLIVAEQLDDDDADHPVVEHQHEGDYIKMMNDWNLSLRSTGMALLLALNWSFFLHLALSRQEPVTWTHNAIHKVLYFVAVSGSFKLEGVPPVGVYVVCSTIGPWNVGDYIQIHSALSLTAECWTHLMQMYGNASHIKQHRFTFPGHGNMRLDVLKPARHFLPTDYARCVGSRNGGDPSFARSLHSYNYNPAKDCLVYSVLVALEAMVFVRTQVGPLPLTSYQAMQKKINAPGDRADTARRIKTFLNFGSTKKDVAFISKDLRNRTAKSILTKTRPNSWQRAQKMFEYFNLAVTETTSDCGTVSSAQDAANDFSVRLIFFRVSRHLGGHSAVLVSYSKSKNKKKKNKKKKRNDSNLSTTSSLSESVSSSVCDDAQGPAATVVVTDILSPIVPIVQYASGLNQGQDVKVTSCLNLQEHRQFKFDQEKLHRSLNNLTQELMNPALLPSSSSSSSSSSGSTPRRSPRTRSTPARACSDLRGPMEEPTAALARLYPFEDARDGSGDPSVSSPGLEGLRRSKRRRGTSQVSNTVSPVPMAPLQRSPVPEEAPGEAPEEAPEEAPASAVSVVTPSTPLFSSSPNLCAPASANPVAEAVRENHEAPHLSVATRDPLQVRQRMMDRERDVEAVVDLERQSALSFGEPFSSSHPVASNLSTLATEAARSEAARSDSAGSDSAAAAANAAASSPSPVGAAPHLASGVDPFRDNWFDPVSPVTPNLTNLSGDSGTFTSLPSPSQLVLTALPSFSNTGGPALNFLRDSLNSSDSFHLVPVSDHEDAGMDGDDGPVTADLESKYSPLQENAADDGVAEGWVATEGSVAQSSVATGGSAASGRVSGGSVASGQIAEAVNQNAAGTGRSEEKDTDDDLKEGTDDDSEDSQELPLPVLMKPSGSQREQLLCAFLDADLIKPICFSSNPEGEAAFEDWILFNRERRVLFDRAWGRRNKKQVAAIQQHFVASDPFRRYLADV